VRKLVLIAAFALASVSAQAGERIDRVPADNNAPAAAVAPATALPATADTAKPQASRKQVSRQQASGARMTRREIGEQKARQIAAQYGISW
jgi:hypothetical protein